MNVLNIAYTAISKFEIAFITLFAGLLVSRIVGKIVKRMLIEAELNKLFSTRSKSINNIIGTSVEGFLYLITVIIVLQQLGFSFFIFYLGLIIVALVISIVLTLAVKQIPNLIAGIWLRNSFSKLVGRKVRVGDINGKLESFSLLQSRIKGAELFLVPHFYSWKNKLRKIRAD